MRNNYTITLLQNQELVLDVDELECIIQQLAAIQNGYGHDYETVFIQDEIGEETTYVWEREPSVGEG